MAGGFDPTLGRKSRPRSAASAPRGPIQRPGVFGHPVAGLTHGRVVHSPAGDMTLNVRALQRELRRAGYNVSVDGQLGPLTLRALQDWAGHGHKLTDAEGLALRKAGTKPTPPMGPRAFNRFVKKSGTPPYRPATGHGGALDTAGNPVGQGPVGNGGGGTVSLSDLLKMSKQKTKLLDPSLANFGTMIDPSTADAIGGAPYNAQIAAAKLAVQRDPLQALQNQNDISSWYKQAIDSLQTASGRDTTASDAGVSSIKDIGQALVSSLGGSANAGSAEVGAAGEDAAGTLAAQGAAQSQYESDLAPILQAEKSSQLTQQKNRDTATLQSDRNALAGLKSSRDAAVQAALAQIEQQNNGLSQARAGTRLDIAKENAALTQQGYQNALALAQAQIAAEMSGLNVDYKMAQIRHEQGLANHNSGIQPFTALPLSDRKSVMAAATSALQDGSGNWLKLSPQQAQARMMAAASGTLGYSPKPGTVAMHALMQGPFSLWQQSVNG